MKILKTLQYSAITLTGILVVACGGASDKTISPISAPLEQETSSQSPLFGQLVENQPSLLLGAAESATPAIRSRILDVNARTSEITHNFDLGSFDISFRIYSSQFVPTGDITGDGIDDVFFTDQLGFDTSPSALFPGHTSAWTPSLYGAGSSTGLDKAISLSVLVDNGVGDINGDNRQDLKLSTFQRESSSSICYILLDVSVVQNASPLPEPDGKTVLQIEYPGRIVERIEGIGDTDGDGLDDLLVYFSHSESSQSSLEAYIILGRTEWPAIVEVTAAQAGVIPLLIGSSATNYAEIRAVGDVNGDSLADFLISYGIDRLPDASPFDAPYGYGQEQYRSFMNNVIMGRDWRRVPGLRIDHESPNEDGVFSFEHTSIFEPMLDITGDGLDDLFINLGDWSEKPGSVRIMQGRHDYSVYESDSEPGAEVSWEMPRSLADRFYSYAKLTDGVFNTSDPGGYAPSDTEVLSGGDFDGDGINDILIYQYSRSDYYHWRIGQYYILYGDRSLAGDSRQSNAVTLVSNAHGRPVVLGDIDNDGADDIGIATTGYPVDNRLENIALLVGEQDGEEYLSLTHYTNGPIDGHLEHDKSVLTTQIVLSPGLQSPNVSEAWQSDVNQLPILVDPDLLQSLMELIDATDSIDSDAQNPLNWKLAEITRTPERDLAGITLHQNEGGFSGKTSQIEISNNGKNLAVNTSQSYYSARTAWAHNRDCEVNLESGQVLDHFYYCRDALSLAIQRLLAWK